MRSIEIGRESYCHASVVTLSRTVDGMTLETLDLGYQVFTWCQEVVFESNQVV